MYHKLSCSGFPPRLLRGFIGRAARLGGQPGLHLPPAAGHQLQHQHPRLLLEG